MFVWRPGRPGGSARALIFMSGCSGSPPTPLGGAPARGRAAGAAGRFGASADFHVWLQWLADDQLAAALDAARGAGMGIGVIRDLAVGSHPGGADAWSGQDVLVPGIR